MNFVNLELCKELYELSGHTWLGDIGDHKPEYVAAPAYSLGYLLRNLPPYIEGSKQVKWPIRIEYLSNTTWRMSYPLILRGVLIGEADNPEDCAVLLAIALFEHEILKREGQ